MGARARHPGDCALYISYENTDVPTNWIKLADFPGCVDQATFPTFDGVAPPQDNKWSLTLPSWLPSSDHAVLRWEWMAVQQVVNVEFYTTCADVKIVGTTESTADFLSKVSPVVTFSGTDHLPADADAYRKAYNGEFVASLDSEFLVGPAVATYNGEAPPVADPPVVDPAPEQPEVPETPPEEPEQPEEPPEEEDPPVDPPVEEPSEPTEPTDYLMPTAWAAHDSHELTLLRLDEFTSALTSVVGTEAATGTSERVVHSSGGVAGGVVSEGQGYGLLLAGAAAAALPVGHERREDVTQLALEFFRGWQRMCELTERNSCQDSHMCGAQGNHECLPSWKFDNAVTMEDGTGSAPDGDEDAILGMLLLVLATEAERPSWWLEVAQWTYQSCHAFLVHLTVEHPNGDKASNGEVKRALKLGSCWGGWDCNNPSYHAPGHYRAFRDYMKKFAATFGASSAEGTALAPQWDSLIETSHSILSDAQCDATGLVPNWYRPIDEDTGCSGSSTPPAEFGSEASRAAWRVALDSLWWGDAAAGAFNEKMADQVTTKLVMYGTDGCWSLNGCEAMQLDTGCLVTSIHADWIYNMFMLAPMATSLAVPLPGADATRAAEQQLALDNAASLLDGQSITDYYSGSWVAIATLTLSGDLPSLAPMLAALTDGTVVTPPIVVPEPPDEEPEEPPEEPEPPVEEPETPPEDRRGAGGGAGAAGGAAHHPEPPVEEPEEPEACASPIATWGQCGGGGVTGCCGSSDSCYKENQWYSQCRPAADGCPTGWECDTEVPDDDEPVTEPCVVASRAFTSSATGLSSGELATPSGSITGDAAATMTVADAQIYSLGALLAGLGLGLLVGACSVACVWHCRRSKAPPPPPPKMAHVPPPQWEAAYEQHHGMPFSVVP